MNIYVTSGVGLGKTPLSAFDAALKNAGVYNYNLIILSSVIPPNTTIVTKKWKKNDDEHGHKLYVVKAEIRSRESGKYIGSALGWYQLPDGRGVFVEHEEIGETKESVEANLSEDVRKSLTDLCRSRKYPLNEKSMHIKQSILKVKDSPACALVIGVYKSEGWT